MAKKRKPIPGVPPTPEALWVEIESEADVVYLYDEGHRATLEKSAMSEYGGSFWEEDECGALAERGIVLHLLYSAYAREEPFHAYVYVGPPPDPTLLPSEPGNATQCGWLHLPTGQLRIETYSALRIGPDEPEHEGVEIKLPPGSYDVCLSQAKPFDLGEDEYALLYDYLSLTPRMPTPAAAAPPKKRNPSEK